MSSDSNPSIEQLMKMMSIALESQAQTSKANLETAIATQKAMAAQHDISLL